MTIFGCVLYDCQKIHQKTLNNKMETVKRRSGTEWKRELLRLRTKWGLPDNLTNIHQNGQSVN